ncbi:hypothetical protein A2U01_0108815, partial [Trifolium medium]|nr:hypothetical protein [Trifolium medium]
MFFAFSEVAAGTCAGRK